MSHSWSARVSKHTLSGIAAVALLAGASVSARAAVVTFEFYAGGQGIAAQVNGPSYLPINATDTTHFQITILYGVLTGDVVTHNNGGTQFDLTITNLHVEGTLSGEDTRAHITALQTFESPSAITWLASHSVTGSTNAALAKIDIDTTHDYMGSNIALTPLAASGSGTLSDGPYSSTVTQAAAGSYGIYADMELRITGGLGYIDLPNSYETRAIAVPAPGALALMGTGLIAGGRRARVR